MVQTQPLNYINRLFKSPTHGKVSGNICVINLVSHAILPDSTIANCQQLQCKYSCVHVLANLKAFSPRDHEGLFSVEKI